MKKIILPVFILLAATAILPEEKTDSRKEDTREKQNITQVEKQAPEDKISWEVQVPAEKKPSAEGLNMYFPIHYVYMNVLAILGLDTRLDSAAKTDIIRKMTANISDSGSRLVIRKFDGENDLFVVMRTDSNNQKNKKLLWIVSNYNASEGKIITREEDMENAYATFFEFFNDSIVKFQNVDAKDKEAGYKEKNDLNNLADLYLFDSNAQNNSQIPELLDKNLAGESDTSGKFISYLTYLQYNLSLKEYDKAKKNLEDARALINEKTENRKNFIRFLQMAEDEYEITRQLIPKQ